MDESETIDFDRGRLLFLQNKDEENGGVDFKNPGQENDPSSKIVQ